MAAAAYPPEEHVLRDLREEPGELLVRVERLDAEDDERMCTVATALLKELR